jgi:hypothetical protein
MGRARLAVLSFVVCLAVTPTAVAAHTAVSGTGALSGSGTSYTLVVTSTGSDSIRCMRYFAPSGTTIQSASGPGSTAAFGNGFGSQGLNLSNGQSASFAFTTSQPLTADRNGELHLSTDCSTDVTGPLSGPAAAQPPAAQPCECISFYARVLPKSITITNPGELGGLHMEFDVAWFMNCTQGSGGCNGQFELLPPQPALALKARLKPISGHIDCITDCATQKTGIAHFTLIGGPALGNAKRKGKSFTLTLKRTCQGKAVAPQTFTFVFNRVSLVNKAKSRLK